MTPQEIDALRFRDYSSLFSGAASAAGASVLPLSSGGCCAQWRGHGPGIALLSGVHGEERAGPIALLGLVQDLAASGLAFPLWVCPLLNGDGWDARTRCWRKRNLNDLFLSVSDRPPPFMKEVMAQLAAFRPALFADLHEDSASTRAYLFKFNRDPHTLCDDLAEHMGCWACPWAPGPRWDGSSENFVRGLGCDRTVTLETPLAWPLEKRVAWHRRALDWLLSEGVAGQFAANQRPIHGPIGGP